MDIQFDCVDINISHSSGNIITVEASDIDIEDIFNDVISAARSVGDILDVLNDNGTVLDAIGIEECKKYFDLIEI